MKPGPCECDQPLIDRHRYFCPAHERHAILANARRARRRRWLITGAMLLWLAGAVVTAGVILGAWS